MEKRDTAKAEIQAVDGATRADERSRFPYSVDVPPKQHIHPAEVEVQAVCLLDPQELSVVFKELSLVVQLVKAPQLVGIRGAAWINALEYIDLLERNIAVKIDDIIIIDVVIHLVIHAFHNVCANDGSVQWQDLIHILFDILDKVPSHDENDILLVILGQDLQAVLVRCLHEFDDLSVIRERQVHVLKGLAVGHLKLELVLALHHFAELQIVAAVNDNEMIVVELGVDQGGILVFYLKQVFPQVLIFRIVMQHFWSSALQHSHVVDFLFKLTDSPLDNFGHVVLGNEGKLEVLIETEVSRNTSVSILFEDADNHFALLLLF